MTYTFKLSRRIARLRAPLLAALFVASAGCESADPVGPTGSSDQISPIASAEFAGGIPFGFFAQPTTAFGPRYNGGHQNISPNRLLTELAAIKGRGGKVVLSLAGSPKYYLDGGHFSLAKWKSRVDRYKDINMSAYTRDGTIIGHYMIDEPNDPANWNGQPVPPSMLEEMAKYSKQLWPDMPTLVRVEPAYLASNHRYLDAAWAQYLNRRGSVDDYIRRNVAEAQERGLALVVGMNVLKGGTPNLTSMTASQVQSWGSALLSSTYPCAFISWQYDQTFLSSNGMGSAMDALRHQAENRGTRSCGRGASSGGETPPPPPTPAPSSGVPFGLYSLPTSELASFSGSVQRLTPATVLATARAARQAGASLIVRLADRDVVNGDGTFSLSKWKSAVDRYASVDLSSFISDGTIAGHLLIQNPQNAGLWGRQAISHATIEEMARYSRQRWPGLPTIAHAPATWLAGKTTAWQYLDASSVMYRGSYGDAATWVAGQASAAGKARLGLLVGMNALNGGTSASGLPGTSQGMYAMSASQLGSWGSAVLAQSRVCGLMLSRHDATYFGRSDVKASVATLAAKAGGRATTPCRVRT